MPDSCMLVSHKQIGTCFCNSALSTFQIASRVAQGPFSHGLKEDHGWLAFVQEILPGADWPDDSIVNECLSAVGVHQGSVMHAARASHAAGV